MLHLFIKGGPIMWPLLAASLVALSVIFERILAARREQKKRNPTDARTMLTSLKGGDILSAITIGHKSTDFTAECLAFGLRHSADSFAMAYQHRAHRELRRLSRGLPVLDTIVTMAPLLGLLGTVTGMIRAFGLMGASELEAPAAITGGIAEALIATAFGLGIAITSLIPFNWLNTRLEKAQHDLQDVGSQAELLLTKTVRDESRYSAPIPQSSGSRP